jgi:hypothetical protein
MNQIHGPTCRFCGRDLVVTFVDLGMSPLCESYLSLGQLSRMEAFYPLHVWVCSGCFLVQLEEFVSREEIFTEYAYFSSYSTSWVEHARQYVHQVVERFGLGSRSLAVEVASNDGYLLQHFLGYAVPVLGIEPARNVAEIAVSRGIPTLTEFFGVDLATRLREEGRMADLVVGNNVLAQVPDLNDFVEGIRILLAPRGVASLEFPHLARLIEQNQFDTIYHEHYSYFSLYTTRQIFREHGLEIFDVEEIPTHGGSLRVYARQVGDSSRPATSAVTALIDRELAAGVNQVTYYEAFGDRVKATKRKLLAFLIAAAEAGKQVVGYGAPGKGNTLLNYCGIREDLLEYTVDRNPYKHGKYLPGTHIPIYDVDRIAATRPDYLLILPWNLKEEIVAQTAYIREWGGRHVVPIPETKVIE